MKILLAVDGSPYTQRMLDYVAAHDELFGKSHAYTAITVVGALPAQVSRYIDRETIAGYNREEADKVLKPVRAFAAQHGLAIAELQPAGHAGEEIAEAARQGAFDLIVMGSHGHSAFGSLMLGSVTARVLAKCEVPLLIVR